MSEHQESDALEHADSDQSDDSSSSDALADTGPSTSDQHELYLAPGDELSCGTHLTLPSAPSAGSSGGGGAAAAAAAAAAKVAYR